MRYDGYVTAGAHTVFYCSSNDMAQVESACADAAQRAASEHPGQEIRDTVYQLTDGGNRVEVHSGVTSSPPPARHRTLVEYVSHEDILKVVLDTEDPEEAKRMFRDAHRSGYRIIRTLKYVGGEP